MIQDEKQEYIRKLKTMPSTIKNWLLGFVLLFGLFIINDWWSAPSAPPSQHEVRVCEAKFNLSNGRQLDDHCRQVLAENQVAAEEASEHAAKP